MWPDLIASLRVDYSEQYVTHEPIGGKFTELAVYDAYDRIRPLSVSAARMVIYRITVMTPRLTTLALILAGLFYISPTDISKLNDLE